MKVLVADDHAIVRKGLIQLLVEEFPIAIIEEANSAADVLNKISESKYDLLICDINMPPGISGIEALLQIKINDPDLPVLIMSMYSEDLYAIQAFKSGAAGYLNKETIHIELMDAIYRVLNGKKYITSSLAEKIANSFNKDFNKPLHENLSVREFEVFKLIATGKSITEIADYLTLSTTTISTYKVRIFEKMGMLTNAELTRYAINNNIID